MKKYAILIYTDAALMDAVPAAELDDTLRGCIEHADDMRRDGTLLDSQMLAAGSTARTVRERDGRRTVVDGPFAETKELLAGFNIVEAADIEEATALAASFQWTRFGSIEVREIQDFAAVRARVGAA